MIDVMLVDDHTVLRGGLKLLLNQQEDVRVVAETADASTVLQLAEQTKPNVIVLDLSLGESGGLALIEPLTAFDFAPRVLVLSMHDDVVYVRSALAAGATGYVVKTISEQSLLAAVRTVAQGRVIVDLDDETLNAGVFHAMARGHSGQLGAMAKLSDREGTVLSMLGRGMTNQAVAEALDVSPKTVATYRARIGEKLGLHTTAEFVKFAKEMKIDGPNC